LPQIGPENLFSIGQDVILADLPEARLRTSAAAAIIAHLPVVPGALPNGRWRGPCRVEPAQCSPERAARAAPLQSPHPNFQAAPHEAQRPGFPTSSPEDIASLEVKATTTCPRRYCRLRDSRPPAQRRGALHDGTRLIRPIICHSRQGRFWA
jgi:hypothetical protein